MPTLWTPAVIGGVHSARGHLAADRTVSKERTECTAEEAVPTPVAAVAPTAPAAPTPVAEEAVPRRAAVAVPIPPARAEAADPTGPRSPHPHQYLLQQ
jgi:hypothetical protein